MLAMKIELSHHQLTNYVPGYNWEIQPQANSINISTCVELNMSQIERPYSDQIHYMCKTFTSLFLLITQPYKAIASNALDILNLECLLFQYTTFQE